MRNICAGRPIIYPRADKSNHLVDKVDGKSLSLVRCFPEWPVECSLDRVRTVSATDGSRIALLLLLFPDDVPDGASSSSSNSKSGSRDDGVRLDDFHDGVGDDFTDAVESMLDALLLAPDPCCCCCRSLNCPVADAPLLTLDTDPPLPRIDLDVGDGAVSRFAMDVDVVVVGTLGSGGNLAESARFNFGLLAAGAFVLVDACRCTSNKQQCQQAPRRRNETCWPPGRSKTPPVGAKNRRRPIRKLLLTLACAAFSLTFSLACLTASSLT